MNRMSLWMARLMTLGTLISVTLIAIGLIKPINGGYRPTSMRGPSSRRKPNAIAPKAPEEGRIINSQVRPGMVSGIYRFGLSVSPSGLALLRLR
jgi:hypothetical protein